MAIALDTLQNTQTIESPAYSQVENLDQKLDYLGIDRSELDEVLQILESGDKFAIHELVDRVEQERRLRYERTEYVWVNELQAEWGAAKDSDSPEAQFRKQIHQEIIDEELALVESNIQKMGQDSSALVLSKSLTFIAGLPGAGKSSRFDQNLDSAWRGRHLPVDADNLRAKLWKKLQERYAEQEQYKSVISGQPEYNDANYDQVIALQQEAADLTRALIDQALRHKLQFPIYYMGTLRNASKINSFIELARENNATVYAVHLMIPLKDAFLGVLHRSRQIDLPSLVSCTATYDTFRDLVESGELDKAQLMRSGQRGIEPARNYPITEKDAIIAELNQGFINLE